MTVQALNNLSATRHIGHRSLPKQLGGCKQSQSTAQSMMLPFGARVELAKGFNIGFMVAARNGCSKDCLKEVLTQGRF